MLGTAGIEDKFVNDLVRIIKAKKAASGCSRGQQASSSSHGFLLLQEVR